mmetsp:Transcript_15239/g.29275  ORF Transcript_15239/g.29275 Transcript_15239/m.29275 type:complete len:204 (-) Transcript_15239:991-1602(-)
MLHGTPFCFTPQTTLHCALRCCKSRELFWTTTHALALTRFAQSDMRSHWTNTKVYLQPMHRSLFGIHWSTSDSNARRLPFLCPTPSPPSQAVLATRRCTIHSQAPLPFPPASPGSFQQTRFLRPSCASLLIKRCRSSHPVYAHPHPRLISWARTRRARQTAPRRGEDFRSRASPPPPTSIHPIAGHASGVPTNRNGPRACPAR